MRIILFTGKDGVGKTTLAAAIALKAARQSTEKLVIATDPAHCLSDALDAKLSTEPVEIFSELVCSGIRCVLFNGKALK